MSWNGTGVSDPTCLLWSHESHGHSLSSQQGDALVQRKGGEGRVWLAGVAGELGLNVHDHTLRTHISCFTKLTIIHQFVPFNSFNGFLVKEHLLVKAFDKIFKHKEVSGTRRSPVSLKW